jgi:hypothetical protein
MDQLNQYREIVKKTILKYAQFCPSHGQIELHPVFDDSKRSLCFNANRLGSR